MQSQRIRVPNLGATMAALSASFSTPPGVLAMPLIDGAVQSVIQLGWSYLGKDCVKVAFLSFDIRPCSNFRVHPWRRP
jgi:hypothetical protein